MKFTLNKMKQEDAHQIASWHYEAPYDFYDSDQDPEDLAELLNPQSWQESYYSVFNEENELVGLFVFKRDSQTVEVGLGLATRSNRQRPGTIVPQCRDGIWTRTLFRRSVEFKRSNF